MNRAAQELIAVQQSARQKRMELERYGIPLFSKSVPEAMIATTRCNCCGAEFLDAVFQRKYHDDVCPICAHGMLCGKEPLKEVPEDGS